MDLRTLNDIQKHFGERPLNSIQPPIHLKQKPSRGKIALYVIGGVVSLVGVWTIFSKIKSLTEPKLKKN